MSSSNQYNDSVLAGLIILTLIVVVAAIALSDGANKQDSSYAEQQCTAQQLEHARSRSVPVIERKQASPSDNPAPQREEQQHGEPNWCDIAAQQSMANSTLGAKNAAWVSVVFTLAGVVLIGFTLVYTARTLDEARETTNVARKMLLAQERPWISVDMRVGSDLVFENREGRIAIDFLLKNHGKSPAIQVELEHKIVVNLSGAWEEMKKISNAAKERSRKRSEYMGHRIFPDQPAFTYSISMPIERKEIEEFAKLVNSEDIKLITAFIIGCVVYKTAFGDENHVTEFFVMLGTFDESQPLAVKAISTEDGVTSVKNLRLRYMMGSGSLD